MSVDRRRHTGRDVVSIETDTTSGDGRPSSSNFILEYPWLRTTGEPTLYGKSAQGVSIPVVVHSDPQGE